MFFKGLNSSGDLTPSTPGLLHAESYSLAIQSAVLFPALWIPSLVSTKKTPQRGWARWGGPPVLPFCRPLSPCRVPGPVLGSGTLETVRVAGETEMVGGVGAQTSRGGKGRFLGGADISVEL